MAFNDGQFGLQQAAIQPDQQIARLDRLRLFHGDFGNNAAIGVLHDLAVLRDFKLARRHDGPVDFGEQRPAAKAADQQGNGDKADDDRAAG